MKQTISKIMMIMFVGGYMFLGLYHPTMAAPSPTPYVKTFVVTAYSSPLPNQQTYATGSYETDIILNGNGTHGADDTAVYPGMIAAPASYAFGTKIKVPGIGIGAVHDRGGAIVEADDTANQFDRLDIWMGHGDVGLQRALSWGRRTVEITVYGINPALHEEVNWKDIPVDMVSTGKPSFPQKIVTSSVVPKPTMMVSFAESLEYGAKNDDVRRLQQELYRLHLLGVEPTGYYGELTEHAVFKFQQANGLVSTHEDVGSGVFGPKTRQKMNEIITQRMAMESLRKG